MNHHEFEISLNFFFSKPQIYCRARGAKQDKRIVGLYNSGLFIFFVRELGMIILILFILLLMLYYQIILTYRKFYTLLIILF